MSFACKAPSDAARPDIVAAAQAIDDNYCYLYCLCLNLYCLSEPCCLLICQRATTTTKQQTSLLFKRVFSTVTICREM